MFTSSVMAQKKPIGFLLGVISEHHTDHARYERILGVDLTTMSMYRSFGGDYSGFDADPLILSYAKGNNLELFVSWQPQYEETDYLSQILAGEVDTYIREFARDIKEYGNNVWLSFAPEMNGGWSTWGQRPEEFKSAYQYIYRLFSEEAVTNVLWVWQVNVILDGEELNDYYPGDFINIIGIDGYNWGGDSWESFESVFAETYEYLTEWYAQNIYITETGSAPGPQKASWIIQMFMSLGRFPRIIGINWFNFDKENDWRIASGNQVEAEAQSRAFSDGVSIAQTWNTYRLATVVRTMLSVPDTEDETPTDADNLLANVNWMSSNSNYVTESDGTITFLEVPETADLNAMMLTTPIALEANVKYRLTYFVTTQTVDGDCGVFIDTVGTEKAGDWLGPVEDGQGLMQYDFSLDEGVFQGDVQFYCAPGATQAPVISNVVLMIDPQ